MPKAEQQKSGTVLSFNVSPKGSYEGLLLESIEGLIQINFHGEWSAALMKLAAPGTHIRAKVETFEGKGSSLHPVYQLLSLSDDKNKKLSLDEPNGHDAGAFTGKIERLNYALHGEVNGAILDSGDFLHVKPHGAAALGLTVGMKVKGTGGRKPMIDGHQVIEADNVNGIEIEKKPKPKKKAHA